MAVSSVAGKKLWTRGVAAAILLQMDAYRREVGARLRGLRRSRNWSQEDAAHAVGVTSSAWGRWERGITSPYESNWQRIAEVFGDEEAREARGRPPAPLALGEGNGDPERLTALEALVGDLDEQLRLLRAETATRDAEAQRQTEARLQTIEDLLRQRPA